MSRINQIKKNLTTLWHCTTVLVFSICAPLWDTFKDWYLVLTLFLTKNYAWGSLFLFPILHGYLGQFLMWRNEERNNESPRSGIRWNWPFFPFYGLLRSWSLLKKMFKVLQGKSSECYKNE